jgi:hypothetical protein
LQPCTRNPINTKMVEKARVNILAQKLSMEDERQMQADFMKDLACMVWSVVITDMSRVAIGRLVLVVG